MSVSDNSEKLNNCETCEQIKNKEFDNDDDTSNYSSDCEDLTTFSDSLDKETNSDYLRLNFNGSRLGQAKTCSRRPTVQQNKTFSSEKIREIERRNAMLVDKILYHNRRPNQYKSTAANLPKVTSSEINRRRHQEKISRENEIPEKVAVGSPFQRTGGEVSGTTLYDPTDKLGLASQNILPQNYIDDIQPPELDDSVRDTWRPLGPVRLPSYYVVDELVTPIERRRETGLRDGKDTSGKVPFGTPYSYETFTGVENPNYTYEYDRDGEKGNVVEKDIIHATPFPG